MDSIHHWESKLTLFYFVLNRILLIQFLTAISFAIAVLEVGPNLVIFADLSFVEHCRVLFSFAMRSAPYSQLCRVLSFAVRSVLLQL